MRVKYALGIFSPHMKSCDLLNFMITVNCLESQTRNLNIP